MQRTAENIRITVGESRHPITLTDSAVEAVQLEADGQGQHALEALHVEWSHQLGSLADCDVNKLLELRAITTDLAEALDVLIELRPDDEVITDGD